MKELITESRAFILQMDSNSGPLTPSLVLFPPMSKVK